MIFSRRPEETIVLISSTQVFRVSSWPSLKSLKNCLARPDAWFFSERHGGALTLLQFYDYELRSFTFQDYQIVPTPEGYSHMFKITKHILIVVRNKHDF